MPSSSVAAVSLAAKEGVSFLRVIVVEEVVRTPREGDLRKISATVYSGENPSTEADQLLQDFLRVLTDLRHLAEVGRTFDS